MYILTFIFMVIIGYLIGSINFSFLFGKRLKGIDIRQHGSGNAGATNTLRVLGKGPAVLVLLLDLFKGIAAIIIAEKIAGPLTAIPVYVGVAAILGHNWPIYYGFRGGKGVATTVGVMAYFAFFPAILSAIIALLVIAVTRYVSLGSLTFMVALSIFSFIDHQPPLEIFVSFVVLLLSIFRHRHNIVRLWNGSENKLGHSKDKGGKQHV